MDDAMRARFVKALEAKGIRKGNWREASMSVRKPNGRPLGQTFLRDAIMRSKGKDEYVQWVCAHFGISWDYVKFNRGPMIQAPLLAIEYAPAAAATEPAETVTVNRVQLIGAIEGVCRLLGASEQRARRFAREALAIAQGRELSD